LVSDTKNQQHFEGVYCRDYVFAKCGGLKLGEEILEKCYHKNIKKPLIIIAKLVLA